MFETYDDVVWCALMGRKVTSNLLKCLSALLDNDSDGEVLMLSR